MKKKHPFIIFDHCIACTTCSKVAPEIFTLNTSATTAIIIQQPVTEQNQKKKVLKQCEAAQYLRLDISNDNYS